LNAKGIFANPAQTHEASKKNTAALNDGTGTVYRTAFLRFQLQNCGANIPLTGGTSLIAQDSLDIKPIQPSGAISIAAGPTIASTPGYPN
jgi:hypothetical protein